MSRERLDELTDRWRARHDARRPDADARPRADTEREALAASRLPVSRGRADDVRGRARRRDDRLHLRRGARYTDPDLDAWLLEVGRLLREATMSRPAWAIDLVAVVCADAGAPQPNAGLAARRGPMSTGVARRRAGSISIRAGHRSARPAAHPAPRAGALALPVDRPRPAGAPSRRGSSTGSRSPSTTGMAFRHPTRFAWSRPGTRARSATRSRSVSPAPMPER